MRVPVATPNAAEIGAGQPPGRVHVGTCWDTGKRCAPASADQIRDLLAQGVPACRLCRPDSELGLLDS
ncbi:DUF6233 domain-containing protein [Streptomyces goshikiensis]|uniref:DUF6233 domain-containing protein n=1 Tax=Streptomyces goshikiensis TaxID=1942 RepID=UPI003712BD65